MAGLKRRGAGKVQEKTSDFINLVDGQEYEGRLVYVADLGLHERKFGTEVNPPCQKIALGIEIIGEVVELEDGKTVPRILWDKPLNIYHELTEKGNELVAYKVFNPKAKAETVADWDKQLGKPVSVLITHFNKDDKVYDNIDTLTAIPVRYQADIPAAVTEPCIGDADDEDNACTKALFGLAKWMYERRIDEGIPGQEEPEELDDDDIPF